MEIVVVIYLFLIAVTILFQLALALGAPLGEYALGGKFPGAFPPKLRVAALVQILILILFAFIVLSASGLAFNQFENIGRIGIWVVAVFFVFGSIMNLSSSSRKERNLWGPVNVLLLIFSIYIAISSAPG